jgi:hypothetical protein
MRRKRSKGNDRKPGKGDRPALDREVARLAAALAAIAAMEALPLGSSAPPRRRRRRCAT